VFPGRINPKKMKQMMKQMGMEMEPIEGITQVVISTTSGEYVFDQAEVVAVKMQGVTTYQLTGEARFVPAALQVPEEDVRLVTEQTGVPEEKARATLLETGGDIAEAILRLTPHD
jgi:nascent polypeptide-associated complex subunit alpha